MARDLGLERFHAQPKWEIPVQRKNLADDPAHASAKAELKKWLPKKNAPHFGAPKRK
jgi:hypothetical protein